MSYISGKASTRTTNPKDLPIGAIIDVANPQTEFYKSSYHWVKFEKIGADDWRIKSVWFVSEKGYNEVESNTHYTTDDVMKLACKPHKFNGKEYPSNDFYLLIPLISNEGKMNCLLFDEYSVEYRKGIDVDSLLRECADDYSRTFIKFRFDDKEKMTINIVKGNRKYLITCTETEFDNYCNNIGVNIIKNAYNIYL